jgi:predicted Zn-dependent protease with MMP-like domain
MFERLVREGIADIPERFLEKLDNVAIIISDEPTAEQLASCHVRGHSTLLGLYEGVPQIDRGGDGMGMLPDTITIFQKPILETAPSEDEIREIVMETVWHEIAHHFGMDDAMIHKGEHKRARRRKQRE